MATSFLLPITYIQPVFIIKEGKVTLSNCLWINLAWGIVSGKDIGVHIRRGRRVALFLAHAYKVWTMVCNRWGTETRLCGSLNGSSPDLWWQLQMWGLILIRISFQKRPNGFLLKWTNFVKKGGQDGKDIWLLEDERKLSNRMLMGDFIISMTNSLDAAQSDRFSCAGFASFQLHYTSLKYHADRE